MYLTFIIKKTNSDKNLFVLESCKMFNKIISHAFELTQYINNKSFLI